MRDQRVNAEIKSYIYIQLGPRECSLANIQAQGLQLIMVFPPLTRVCFAVPGQLEIETDCSFQ